MIDHAGEGEKGKNSGKKAEISPLNHNFKR
jgi:hypothetical protein